MKVLEIGTGSGYQCLVLCSMRAKVTSIEYQPVLFEKTKKRISNLKIEGATTPLLLKGDGSLGVPGYAPYDRILVTAGAPVVPQALKEQLVVGGILVIPVGDRKSQHMMKITRTSETEYEEERTIDFKFVPLLGDDGWN